MRKRLTILGVISLLIAVAYMSRTLWLKMGYERTQATVLAIKRLQSTTSPGGLHVSYQATIRYVDGTGTVHTSTTPYSASWLEFDRGAKVTILLNPRDPSDYHFDTFTPQWALPLILLGVGGLTLWFASRV